MTPYLHLGRGHPLLRRRLPHALRAHRPASVAARRALHARRVAPPRPPRRLRLRWERGERTPAACSRVSAAAASSAMCERDAALCRTHHSNKTTYSRPNRHPAPQSAPTRRQRTPRTCCHSQQKKLGSSIHPSPRAARAVRPTHAPLSSRHRPEGTPDAPAAPAWPPSAPPTRRFDFEACDAAVGPSPLAPTLSAQTAHPPAPAAASSATHTTNRGARGKV